jgi:transcriptional regulator with XRE-family HTH domain
MRIKDRLLEKFQSFKYRHAYMDDFTDGYIATQIKVIREQRNLSQKQLADLAKMGQSQISVLEDVNTRSWKVSTLKKLAKAFDLVLIVRFEEFGKMLPDIGHLDRERLRRAAFTNDVVFQGEHRSPNALADLNKFDQPQTARVLNATARFAKEDVPNVA